MMINPFLVLYLSSKCRTKLSLDRKNIYQKICFFKKNGIHSMPGSTATTWNGVTSKRSTKRLKHTGNLFRENLQLKDVC